MKKIITTLLIITLANILCIGFVLAESGKGTVNASELNFRESPNTSANAIDVLYKGAKVNIISEEGDWYKVKYNNEEGYVSKQFITRENSSTNTTQNNTNTITQNNTNTTTQNGTNTASQNNTNSSGNYTQINETNTITSGNETTGGTTTTIDVNDLNKTKIKENTTLYVLPLINSTKLTKINAQAQVLLISVNGDWSYIQTENNNGWVLTKTLEKTSITLSNGETSNNPTNNQGNTTTNNTISENNTTSANNVDNSTVNNTTNSTSNETSNETTPTPSPTATPSNNTYPTTMYVNVEAVNVRGSANTSSTIVTSVGKGQAVTVESKEGDWYKVKTSDGNGYIKGEYLSKNR